MIVIHLGLDRLRRVEFTGPAPEREAEFAMWQHLLPLVGRIDAKLRQWDTKVQRQLKREEHVEAAR